MRVLFFGGKDRGRVCLKAIHTAGHELVGIVWDGDFFCPQYADRVFQVHSDELIHVPDFMKIESDVLVLAGYPHLIKKPLIDLPSIMAINLHAGPLPRYRGPHPMNWMLINGETQGAFSIIEVDEGVDTGPILAQEWYPIYDTTNYRDLLELSLKMYPPILVEVLSKIETGTLKKRRQNPRDGFWCSRRYPYDGYIAWEDLTAEQVYNLCRALVWPMPGAFSYLPELSESMSSSVVFMEEVSLLDRTYFGIPGRVAAHLQTGVVVLCKDKGILVKTCRVDGKLVPAKSVLPATGDGLL